MAQHAAPTPQEQHAQGVQSQQGMAPSEVYTGVQHKRGSRVPTLVWLLLLVVALMAGAAGGVWYGYYQLKEPVSFGTLGGLTTITEAQLDEPVATYTVGEETFEVSARQALLQQSSLENAKVGEGSYVMPSTESVISAARTAILMREVESRGITVTDEELDAYVSETFGGTDYAALATEYRMDEETLKTRMRESAALAKLRAQVVEASESSEPQPPAAPADGNRATESADYAAYIIALAGDEWNAKTGAWVNYDGPYASALRELDVRADAASYEAADVAFNIAYQRWAESAQEGDTPAQQWTNYVNGLLSQANLAVSSLVS